MTAPDYGWTDAELDAEARRRAGLTGDPAQWTVEQSSALMEAYGYMVSDVLAALARATAEVARRYRQSAP